MSVEYGHSEEETTALIRAYVRQTINGWKGFVDESQKILIHLAPGTELYEFHQGRSTYLGEQIAFYESMLVGVDNEQEDNPSPS